MSLFFHDRLLALHRLLRLHLRVGGLLCVGWVCSICAAASACPGADVLTWGDGVDRAAVASPMHVLYDPTGAPAGLEIAVVEAALQRVADAWSQCGKPSGRIELTQSRPVRAGEVLVRWSETDSRGNFGLTYVEARTMVLGPQAFALLRTRNPAHDIKQTLQMVLSHEMGHLWGVIAHSRRCEDSTSYYTNGSGQTCLTRDGLPMKPGIEYRSILPTACDLERCRAANAARAH